MEGNCKSERQVSGRSYCKVKSLVPNPDLYREVERALVGVSASRKIRCTRTRFVDTQLFAN